MAWFTKIFFLRKKNLAAIKKILATEKTFSQQARNSGTEQKLS